MIFNSIEFLIFLPIVLWLYWSFKDKIRTQNWILLISSYVFYAFWDWRFLFLLILSSAADFYIGSLIPRFRDSGKDKRLLHLSLVLNLGILFVFKYFGFFIDSFIALFNLLGIQLDYNTTRIILPLGISFYTFQTLSYTFDIYRKRLKPIDSPLVFFTFVAFFPQLIAGPIERAARMLPIFMKERKFDYAQAVDGMRYILYGLFKKIVIADNCGIYANKIFDNYEAYSSGDLFLGSLFFAAQLYTDFSAYSEIAIGIGKLFGIPLSRNFNYPFFSKNLDEFWQRWHITLTVWFRDYVFMAMRRSFIRSWGFGALILINFTLIGLWHGANMTFILWGFINGVLFLIFQRLKKRELVNPKYGISELRHIPRIIFVQALFIVPITIFRSPSVTESFSYMARMFTQFSFSIPIHLTDTFWMAFLGVWEWNFQKYEHGLAIDFLPKWQRWAIYLILAAVIMYYFGTEQEFLYFQF